MIGTLLSNRDRIDAQLDEGGMRVVRSQVLIHLAATFAGRERDGDIQRARGTLQECVRLAEQIGRKVLAEEARAQLAALAGGAVPQRRGRSIWERPA